MSTENKDNQEPEVQSWYIGDEITDENSGTVDNRTEVEVSRTPLHGSDEDTEFSGSFFGNDTIIAGGSDLVTDDDSVITGGEVITESHEAEDHDTPERVSIMEEAKHSTPEVSTDETSADTEIPSNPATDLVAQRVEATQSDKTLETKQAQATATSTSRLVAQTPEYLREEELESTAERRYGFMTSETAEDSEPLVASPQWGLRRDEMPEATHEEVAQRPSLEETIFEGATVTPAVPSRITAHLWSLLITLIVLPLAWYYCIDVAARLRVGPQSPWQGGPLSFEIIAELIGAIVCVFIVVFVARFSSLGAFFTGIVLTVAGGFCAFVPHLAAAKLHPIVEALTGGNTKPVGIVRAMLSNVGHHLNLSAGSGLFLFMGIMLLAIGFVSHGARRKGRKDYLINRKVEASK